MKRMIFLGWVFCCLGAAAQEDSSYVQLLKNVNEVQLTDSLHIGTAPQQTNSLDSISVKKWFAPLLGFAKNNRLKNRSYCLAGKITSNDHFNLLVLMEEKKKNDSNQVQVVYLVSTKKDGTYIASLEAAVSGVKKGSSFNTSSWLYKDYKIVLDSRITVREKSYDDMVSYWINGGGRFILSAKYE